MIIDPTPNNFSNTMAERSPPQSRIDCDFVEPPPGRLCCGICHNPLRDPLLTSCGHSFCKFCHSTRFRQVSQLCHVCNQSYTTSPDADIAREVKVLQVRCRNKEAGCEWTGDLGDVKDHVVNCGFASLRCTICCQLIQRRLMEEHLDRLCPLRQYSCDYCKTYVNTYNDVTTNHWPVCDFRPVPCPNECPDGSIPRNRLMEHIKNECLVKKDGKSNQLAEAISQCTDLQRSIGQLQERLARMDNEARSQDSKNKELERKRQELQQTLREKDKKISEMEKEVEEFQKELHVSTVHVSLTLSQYLMMLFPTPCNWDFNCNSCSPGLSYSKLHTVLLSATCDSNHTHSLKIFELLGADQPNLVVK